MLIDRYDAALFDLDGVLYLGPDPVVGAPEAVDRLQQLGIRVGFVTNNAARTPKAVADQLRSFGIGCDEADVVTSAQAGVRELVDRFGAGVPVLMVGGEGLRVALDEAGLVAVDSADDNPVAVIQGYYPELSWQMITEAALAIRRGATWVATNTDPTRPTERGLVPGNGAAVAAVRTAVDTDPIVAGKPYRPLMEETVRRLSADRPIFVGDRIDTDIAGAGNLDMDSMLVLTGSHGPVQLFSAVGIERPTHLGRDAGALLQPERITRQTGEERIAVGGIEAYVERQQLMLSREPKDEELLDATWAATKLAWQCADAELPVGGLDLAVQLANRLQTAG
ncbi:HAD-IIA family hydrolase [Microlunatus soli]|uniref:Haloacid Dehalogenase Superfamily Class (Subfamily) IIA n=1 Tax=Microlunatus soli TaxID=630515 RepID=A0A1H1XYE8_9ACTN|nr:HAD-IIA family hydrolase [Microlunatus soli]SDT14268.1 Haloacid Dehalogenase Superfamily Class (subfamily) IIA [Microlunatus soli]